MTSVDTLIRGGNVVAALGLRRQDVAVAEGKIVASSPWLAGTPREIIDATGLTIFPGVIDSHVHFNEPGRTEWEGIATGSAAVAAGGGTMFFDMPLNAHPPTLDAESFRLKRAAAEAHSHVDFALWGGLTPGNLDHMEELAECGVIGFKAFMANSGIDDFPRADDATLREGMKRAAALKRLVAVHAESEEMTSRRLGSSVRDYLNSRPIAAELEAITRALRIAWETNCALHIVHVSSARGVALVAEARGRGVNVTCETCPHYLHLTEEDVERLGAVAKCAPPLRSATEQALLRGCLAAGKIHTVGSDHSPSPPEMKTDSNFFKVWGGISGAQHLLPLMLTLGLEPAVVTRLLSHNVVSRFGLCPTRAYLRMGGDRKLAPKKGLIAIGGDADLALVDLNAEFEVRVEDLLYRHKQSPYVGRRLRGVVRRTIVRGKTVFHDGRIIGPPSGRLITPLRL